MPGISRARQAALCSPTGRQCCTYIIPMKGLKHLHFNPGEFTCMCPHLCWQEKQPHSIPEPYLIEPWHVSRLCRSGKRYKDDDLVLRSLWRKEMLLLRQSHLRGEGSWEIGEPRKSNYSYRNVKKRHINGKEHYNSLSFAVKDSKLPAKHNAASSEGNLRSHILKANQCCSDFNFFSTRWSQT